ncbi:MAG: hypothetical protein GQ578_09745 [Desulfuromonadaceae bacterium]|nr:hypothetical protein [Desulfuromonadaceae bacterium]
MTDKDLQLINDLQNFILRNGIDVTMPSGKVESNPALRMLSWLLKYKQISLPDFELKTELSADQLKRLGRFRQQ